MNKPDLLHGPPIAGLIAPREYAKKLVRSILQPVVCIVKKIKKVEHV